MAYRVSQRGRRGTVVCLTVACAALSVTACKDQAPATPPSRLEVQPEVQQQLISAHTALIQAMEAGDVEKFASFLDPSADLLIFHPLSEDRFTSVAQVRERMPAMFARLGKISWTDAHPSVIQRGEIAWITSDVLVDSPNMSYFFVGRGTEIWVYGGDRWALIHAHWSRQPGADR